MAVVCALALPFAPLSVNEPTVSWPQDPGRPEPTLLNLTAYRPLALDATFTCAAARQARRPPGGRSCWPRSCRSGREAGTEGMVVTARDGRVQVRALGRTLVDDPLAGDCTYTISGTSRGRPEVPGRHPGPARPRRRRT